MPFKIVYGRFVPAQINTKSIVFFYLQKKSHFFFLSFFFFCDNGAHYSVLRRKRLRVGFLRRRGFRVHRGPNVAKLDRSSAIENDGIYRDEQFLNWFHPFGPACKWRCRFLTQRLWYDEMCQCVTSSGEFFLNTSLEWSLEVIAKINLAWIVFETTGVAKFSMQMNEYFIRLLFS